MLRFFTCFVALVVCASGFTSLAPAASPDSKERRDAWQEVLERRNFHLSEEDANILGSLSQFSADCRVHLIYEPKHRPALEFRFSKNGREVLSIKGHTFSAFTTAGDRLYFAHFPADSTGCAVSAYDVHTGKQLWQTELAHKKPAGHSAYANRVTLRMSNINEIKGGVAGAAVIATGSESFCDYVEVLDSKTGEMLALKNYRIGFGSPQPPGGGLGEDNSFQFK